MVWWYSVVAFQCLKVGKLIFRSLGFWSFSARLLRVLQNSALMVREFGFPNMYWVFARASFQRLSQRRSSPLLLQLKEMR